MNDKAITFEKREWCSVYLLVNKDLLRQGKVKIDAYFTLSNQVLRFSDSVSKNKKKKYANGIIPKNDSIPVILIGQIGKYIAKDEVAPIKMEDILSIAEDVIVSVKEKIVCSHILVECKSQNTKLLQKYQKNGFEVLQEIDGYVQLIKKI